MPRFYLGGSASRPRRSQGPRRGSHVVVRPLAAPLRAVPVRMPADMRAPEAHHDRGQRQGDRQGRDEERGEPIPSAVRVAVHEAEIDDQRRGECRDARCARRVAKERFGHDADDYRQHEQDDKRFHGQGFATAQVTQLSLGLALR
jgi:hypothetical protein